jgi:hypothetical protein
MLIQTIAQAWHNRWIQFRFRFMWRCHINFRTVKSWWVIINNYEYDNNLFPLRKAISCHSFFSQKVLFFHLTLRDIAISFAHQIISSSKWKLTFNLSAMLHYLFLLLCNCSCHSHHLLWNDLLESDLLSTSSKASGSQILQILMPLGQICDEYRLHANVKAVELVFLGCQFEMIKSIAFDYAIPVWNGDYKATIENQL